MSEWSRPRCSWISFAVTCVFTTIHIMFGTFWVYISHLAHFVRAMQLLVEICSSPTHFDEIDIAISSPETYRLVELYDSPHVIHETSYFLYVRTRSGAHTLQKLISSDTHLCSVTRPPCVTTSQKSSRPAAYEQHAPMRMFASRFRFESLLARTREPCNFGQSRSTMYTLSYALRDNNPKTTRS